MAEEPEEIQYSDFTLDEVTYKTMLPDKYRNRKRYVAPDPKKIAAVIPGTIIKILVRKGRRIEIGDNLILLEAMKMQSYVQAHIDGKVKKVYVKKGQMVSKGTLMIELE